MNECDYCKSLPHQNYLLAKDLPDVSVYNNLYCGEYTMLVFVDRGHLRMVDDSEINCLDHGEKLKINYCPMCGRNLIKEVPGYE